MDNEMYGASQSSHRRCGPGTFDPPPEAPRKYSDTWVRM